MRLNEDVDGLVHIGEAGWWAMRCGANKQKRRRGGSLHPVMRETYRPPSCLMCIVVQTRIERNQR